MFLHRALLLLLVALPACGPSGAPEDVDGGGGGTIDADMPDFIDAQPVPDGGGQAGCGGEMQACFTVYAHADHVLYRLDLVNQQIEVIGPFNAPLVQIGGNMVEDTITDLAVAPDDTIWAISKTSLYTA